MYLYIIAFYIYCFVSHMLGQLGGGPLRKQVSNDVYKTCDDGLDD
jgi:hypothetical protein